MVELSNHNHVRNVWWFYSEYMLFSKNKTQTDINTEKHGAIQVHSDKVIICVSRLGGL